MNNTKPMVTRIHGQVGFGRCRTTPMIVATGATVKDTEREIRNAIRFHIDGLKEDGQPIPKPTSIADYVEA